MFGSWFLDNSLKPILKKFTVLKTVIQGLHFPLCNLLEIFSLGPRKMGAHVDLPSSTRYVDGWLRFPWYNFMHYINSWCRIVVVVNSPIACESTHGHAWTFSVQVIASIKDDCRCGMWRRVLHCSTNWRAFLFSYSFRPPQPPVRPAYDDNYRSRSYCLVERQKRNE